MPRPDDPRKTQLLGLAVAVVGSGMIAGLFAFTTGEPWADDHVTIVAHFASVSGLKKGSNVMLSGKKIGRVDNVAFVAGRYACDPNREDLGRSQTDDCEPWFFCAREAGGEALCAELLPYTGTATDYDDKGCLVDEQCHTNEICFNEAFRSHNDGVAWYGPENTCIPFQVDHHLVEVALAIQPDKLAFISRDSRASVASKGVLGDQQIAIDAGSGPPIEAGGRLQSEPTLLEELNRFRERIAAVAQRFSGNLAGLRELRGSVRGEGQRPPRDMRTSLGRVGVATGDIIAEQGQVGTLFSDQARDDFMASLDGWQAASRRTSRDIVNFRHATAPRLRDVAEGMDSFGDKAIAATDPKSDGLGAKLLLDERFGLDTAERVSTVSDQIEGARETIGKVQRSVEELERELDAGEGTLGGLVRDPSLYYRFVKAIALFDLFDRNDGFKALTRDVIEAGDPHEPRRSAR